MSPASKAAGSIYCSVGVQSPTEHRLASLTIATLNDGASPLLNGSNHTTQNRRSNMCHYTHFTTEEREKSRVLKAQGLSIRAIARILNRSPSSAKRSKRSSRNLRKSVLRARLHSSTAETQMRITIQQAIRNFQLSFRSG